LQATVDDDLPELERAVHAARQGAATSVSVATSPRLNGVVGRYFENCQEDTPGDPAAAGADAAGVAAYALDPEAAERLWAVSEQMNE
jgi:hypothetical protein